MDRGKRCRCIFWLLAPKAAVMTDDTTHLGYETVPLAEKQSRVNEVFHSVARRYDLMNDLMSAGLHRLWKDTLVTAVRPSRTRPFRHLDVAGGTGDVAFRILDAGGPGTHVTVLDINGAMLSEGRGRAGVASRAGRGGATGARSPATAASVLSTRLATRTLILTVTHIPSLALT